jgi:hypothetical protein
MRKDALIKSLPNAERPDHHAQREPITTKFTQSNLGAGRT